MKENRDIRDEKVGYFEQLKTEYTAEAERLGKKYNRLSVVRVVFFLAVAVWCIYLADQRMAAWLMVTLGVYFFAFGALINRHHRIRFLRDHAQAKADICNEEARRLHLDLEGMEEGLQYLDQGHTYAYDLDIFGRKSIYQWLNRTVTKMGSDLLAASLLYPSGREVVARRQEAAKELANMPDWRMEFGAYGYPYRKEKQNISPFINWMAQEDKPMPAWAGPAGFIIPVFVLLSITGFFMGILPVYLVLIFIGINMVMIKKLQEELQQTEEYTVASLMALEGYEKLIGQLEETEFKSELARETKELLKSGKGASSSIKKLKRLFGYMESRRNMVYQLLNSLFLLDVHILRGLRRWKGHHRNDVGHWFEAIGIFDFLNTLGGVAFAQPWLNWPEVGGHEYAIEGTDMGHPLISLENRVSNDFSFNGKGSVILVTGSNMSGKSTFLRTLGLNVVLALAGAPVSAAKFHTGEIQVFTSMRTQDNLEESVSGFYAELKRLRQLLDLFEQTELPVLFLLDEILKGTNSDDRHRGSEGLVRQLSRMDGFGLVSTHDLTLGGLEESMPNLKNYSFNSHIENGKLVFTYTLTPGICRSFNASKLMQDIGIEVANVKGA